MLQIRPAAERGHVQWSWLDTSHSFSFGEYHDPAHMGFRALRVINDDRIAPGAGFPTHGHRDMEILTWVLQGSLEHKDSLGTGSRIVPGELQRMRAGRGIQHSEFNASRSEPVRLLQIWILPRTQGAEPGYEQRAFDSAELAGRWRLLASPEGAEGSIQLDPDLRLFAARLQPGQRLSAASAAGRHLWLQVATGALELISSGQTRPLVEGDGLSAGPSENFELVARAPSELLLFDLA